MEQTTVDRLAKAAGEDGEFQRYASDWTGRLYLVEEGSSFELAIEAGRPTVVMAVRPPAALGPADVAIVGSSEQWSELLASTPRPPFTHVFGAVMEGMSVNLGGPIEANRYLALKRLSELLRHAANGTDPAPQTLTSRFRPGEFERATGHYVHLDLGGTDYRVYFEEAGEGIGLLCQHTAGADGRQWRHLLEDGSITRQYRVIAYDLPFHGRSLPPEGRAWWAEPYQLTRDFAMGFARTLADVLGLDRPVFLGSSVGGMLALDLARYYPDDFRAVVACEAALKVSTLFSSRTELGPRAATDPAMHAATMTPWMATTAPETYRHETQLHYEQSAPGVFPGDIHYYRNDHDLTGEAERIDTARCPVYLLTGEYDYFAQAMSRQAAEAIRGARFEVMSGLGHFPMSEDPGRFATYLRPILEEIAASS